MLIGLTACQSHQAPSAAVKPAAKPVVQSAAKSAPRNAIRIAVEGNYPPFSFADSAGKLTGFDVDTARALCRQLKLQCEIIQVPFEAFISRLQARDYDAIVSSMEMTDARRKQVSFSDPYYQVPVCLAGRKGLPVRTGSDGYVTPESLAGLRIAVSDSTRADKFAHKTFPDATVISQPSSEDMASALASGEVDLIFEDRQLMQYEIGDRLGTDYQIYGAGYLGETISFAAGIAVRMDDDALRKDINAALQKIRADGTFRQIATTYFSFPAFAE